MRVKVRDQVYTLTPTLALDLAGLSQIEVVVDRLVLEESQRAAWRSHWRRRSSKGAAWPLVEIVGEGTWRLSEQFHCFSCGRIFERPTPLFFSFNNPRGACPVCKGFGNILDYDLNLIIPDPHKSLAEGAIEPWTLPRYVRHYTDELRHLARHEGIDLRQPYHQLPPEQQHKILHGCGDFIGVLPFFRRLEAKKYKLYIRVFLSRYVTAVDCAQCAGTRLRQDALYVKVGGYSIAELTHMTVEELEQFFGAVELDDVRARDRPEYPIPAPGAAEFPAPCGTELSYHRPSHPHAFGRRSPAHQPGEPIGCPADGHAVYPG